MSQISQSKSNLDLVKLIIRVGVFLMPVFVYLPTFWGNAAVPPGQSTYSDLLITHYPYLAYLRGSIISNYQIPLWSTLIYSGAPFAANPLSGLFYLPGWLGMLFPLPAGLSLVLAVHVVFGSIGMYKFLQVKDIGETGRIFGALSFGLMPKLAAHFGAGHITLIYAISWTPWLLYCSERDRRGWLTGLVAGFLFLADPRWAIYAGILWLSYSIAHRQVVLKEKALSWLRTGWIALLISAPMLVPLLEYFKLSTRSGLSADDILYGSLPAGNLIGAILPGAGGNIEWYFYSGGILLLLFIVQLIDLRLRRNNRFWNIWLGVSLLLSLGNWGIEADWIGNIPLINMMRVPARSLFLVGIILAIIAGSSLDQVLKTADESRQRKHYFGMTVAGILMLSGVAIITQLENIMAIWGLAFFAVAGFFMWMRFGNLEKIQLGWILTCLLILDLLGASITAYDIQDKTSRNPSALLSQVLEDDGIFRIYSPSYSLEQYIAAENGLELADGVDPMQLESYLNIAQQATGVSQKGYSVTIPAFETGDPSRDNINAKIDSELLGKLNVKYVYSAFAIDAPGLRLADADGDQYLYINENLLPRAWIERAGERDNGEGGAGLGEGRIVYKSANQIILDAAGPGTLVLSEIQYPGWRVYVDGVREEIGTSHDLFRSVVLNEGDHTVIFKFQPVSVYAGLALAGIGWFLIAYKYFRK